MGFGIEFATQAPSECVEEEGEGWDVTHGQNWIAQQPLYQELRSMVICNGLAAISHQSSYIPSFAFNSRRQI